MALFNVESEASGKATTSPEDIEVQFYKASGCMFSKFLSLRGSRAGGSGGFSASRLCSRSSFLA